MKMTKLKQKGWGEGSGTLSEPLTESYALYQLRWDDIENKYWIV